MRSFIQNRSRGFTFVELLVTVAVFVIVFGGLLASVQFALKLISISKSSTGALTLANERIEYIRSLPYTNIGTVAGIPSGTIPQYATTTLNGVTYYERVLIQYVDSPDDGLGGADDNGILADYKEIKVEYSWATQQGTSSIFLLTDVVPPGIESTDGGGTLTVNVFDATVQPIAGAQVRIYNDTTTSTIDVTRSTNASGIAMFAGAPAGANYEITVTKAGYSIDQTYSASVSNPNPATPHVAVLEGAVSTMNFQIDALSDVLVRTIGPTTDGLFSDSFTDATLTFSMSDVVIDIDSIALTGGAGAYVPLGTVLSASTTPSAMTSWKTASWSGSTPAGTDMKVQVYSVNGSTYTLIPDADLPGNSTGFGAGPIDLSTLDVSTYPTLALGGTLSSSDVNVTPVLDEWSLDYVITEPSIGNIPFTLTGSKVIGTDASLLPIYKYTGSHTTDAGGDIQLQDLEWDFYSLVLGTGAYDISEAFPLVPYTLDPGVDETLTLTLVPNAAYSLRVAVTDSSGALLSGAEVELLRSGFSDTATSSTRGQVFFNSGLSVNSDYRVIVQKAGYVDQTISDITIDGDETMVVVLSPV